MLVAFKNLGTVEFVGNFSNFSEKMLNQIVMNLIKTIKESSHKHLNT